MVTYRVTPRGLNSSRLKTLPGPLISLEKGSRGAALLPAPRLFPGRKTCSLHIPARGRRARDAGGVFAVGADPFPATKNANRKGI